MPMAARDEDLAYLPEALQSLLLSDLVGDKLNHVFKQSTENLALLQCNQANCGFSDSKYEMSRGNLELPKTCASHKSSMENYEG